MHVNCSLGKGIKFVREDLKNFAKSNINTSHGIFKSVVLYNADYLTIDAIRATAVYRDICTNTRFSLLLKININCLTPYYHDSVKYIYRIVGNPRRGEFPQTENNRTRE
jgi:hypothetical protein